MGDQMADNADLREAAAWIAETLRYPTDFTTNEQMPDSLWAALVDHIHADETGKWHGHELTREETESWLADEAGRRLSPSGSGLHMCGACGVELDADDRRELCEDCVDRLTSPPE